jgi:hypothetical protein
MSFHQLQLLLRAVDVVKTGGSMNRHDADGYEEKA